MKAHITHSAPLHLRPREASTDPSTLVVLVWAAVVGISSGALGAAFRLGVQAVRARTEQLSASGTILPGAPWLLGVVVTALMAWAAIFLVRRFAPEGSGSGVQEIEGALEGIRSLRWRRVIPIKFIGGLFSLGGGMVLGREGPTIQMGGALGKMVAERFGLSDHVAHTLIAAGAGAGLTTAFNAPLAGVLFVIEEMRPQFEYSVTSLHAVLIACALADIVVRFLTGQGPVLPITEYDAPSLLSLWLFPICGAVLGTLGVIFNRLLVGTLDLFGRLRGWLQPGAGLLVGALVGFVGWAYPHGIGGGDELVPVLFASPLAPAAIVALFVIRFGTTMLCYGCGAPGGIFAPMLALGSLCGLWCGHQAQAWLPTLVSQPGIFAVAGMGALFSATVRAPITGIALAVELTDDYRQILPLLLTCATATVVAELLGGKPIYSVLLRRTLERQKQYDAAHAATVPGASS